MRSEDIPKVGPCTMMGYVMMKPKRGLFQKGRGKRLFEYNLYDGMPVTMFKSVCITHPGCNCTTHTHHRRWKMPNGVTRYHQKPCVIRTLKIGIQWKITPRCYQCGEDSGECFCFENKDDLDLFKAMTGDLYCSTYCMLMDMNRVELKRLIKITRAKHGISLKRVGFKKYDVDSAIVKKFADWWDLVGWGDVDMSGMANCDAGVPISYQKYEKAELDYRRDWRHPKKGG